MKHYKRKKRLRPTINFDPGEGYKLLGSFMHDGQSHDVYKGPPHTWNSGGTTCLYTVTPSPYTIAMINATGSNSTYGMCIQKQIPGAFPRQDR